DTIARHMVGEALLAAHFVALAEKAGMTPGEINAVLKSVAEKSAIQEFWITDSAGHAYLTNTGVDFTFSPDPAKQPQASAFWPLLSGNKDVVIQGARKREIDDKIFQYVGVAGVDKARIVQVGVGADGARADGRWKVLGTRPVSLAVFQWPQTYVSPSWYPSKREHGKVVPTWNYVVVHAHGFLETVENGDWLLAHIGDLVTANE